MRPRIKVYGLPRSATNMVEWLLRHNVRSADILDNADSGSKHSLACYRYTKKQPSIIVVVVKNPFAWLCSLHRWAWHQPKGRYIFQKPFKQFIRSKIALPELVGKIFWQHPIQAWNLMHEHWLGLPVQRAIITHDALLSKGTAAAWFAAFKRKHKLSLTPKFNFPKGTIKPQMCQSPGPIPHKFYRKREYMKRFTAADKDFVNSELDFELVCRLGVKL